MNQERHEQFLMESKVINDSCEWAAQKAHELDNVYANMTEREVIHEGYPLMEEMIFWESRLELEERILKSHIEKYKDFFGDETV